MGSTEAVTPAAELLILSIMSSRVSTWASTAMAIPLIVTVPEVGRIVKPADSNPAPRSIRPAETPPEIEVKLVPVRPRTLSRLLWPGAPL